MNNELISIFTNDILLKYIDVYIYIYIKINL